MSGFRKSTREIALFLTFMVAIAAHADVKLRIYLQDGSLQAGNLVSETEKTFVILTKEGRVEIPKEKIMFVNGKTLKQWQERPDKLFSTEIIPDEIPNPSYVHGKAPVPDMAAPSLPKVQPVADFRSVLPPAQKPEKVQARAVEPTLPTNSSALSPTESGATQAKPAVQVFPSGAKPVVQPEPAAEAKPDGPVQPGVRKKKQPEPVLAQVMEKPRRSRTKRTKHVSSPALARTGAAASKTKEVVPRGMVTAKIEPEVGTKPGAAYGERPARFNRLEYASYHHDRAMEFLKQGWKGRAVQELHMAVLLDRQKEAPALALGRLYMEEGQFDRAEKYFSHPFLKKREEVKNLIQQIQDTKKEAQRSQWILYGSTGAGVLMTAPLLALVRRRGRKTAKAPRVITADSAEELLPKPAAEEQAEDKRPSVDEILSEVFASRQTHPPIELPQANSAEPPVKLPQPEPVSPELVSPEPAFLKPPEPRAPEPPKELPSVLKEKPEPAPVYEKPEHPVKLPEPVTPEPVLEPVATESQPVASLSNGQLPSVEEVLAVGRQVDEAMQRGNALATECQWDKARREYRTALALNPARVDAYLGLGYLCFSQGQWDLALEHYVKALQIDPNSADAHYGIGRVLLETERVDEAVPRFQMVLQLDPTYDDARESLTALGKPV